MKKFIVVFLAMLIILGLSGCSQEPEIELTDLEYNRITRELGGIWKFSMDDAPTQMFYFEPGFASSNKGYFLSYIDTSGIDEYGNWVESSHSAEGSYEVRRDSTVLLNYDDSEVEDELILFYDGEELKFRKKNGSENPFYKISDDNFSWSGEY